MPGDERAGQDHGPGRAGQVIVPEQGQVREGQRLRRGDDHIEHLRSEHVQVRAGQVLGLISQHHCAGLVPAIRVRGPVAHGREEQGAGPVRIVAVGCPRLVAVGQRGRLPFSLDGGLPHVPDG